MASLVGSSQPLMFIAVERESSECGNHTTQSQAETLHGAIYHKIYQSYRTCSKRSSPRVKPVRFDPPLPPFTASLSLYRPPVNAVNVA